MTDTNKMAQYVANWQDERNGAALYRAISEVEKNPQLKSVYQRLAEAGPAPLGGEVASLAEALVRAAGRVDDDLSSFDAAARLAHHHGLVDDPHHALLVRIVERQHVGIGVVSVLGCLFRRSVSALSSPNSLRKRLGMPNATVNADDTIPAPK